jgi:hypothetical protein
MSYFSSAWFVHRSGQVTDEIAIKPTFCAIRPIDDALSSLVHEMVHARQYHFGRPGRRCYHNGIAQNLFQNTI